MKFPARTVSILACLAATALTTLSGCASQQSKQRVSLQEYMDYQLTVASNPQRHAEFAAMEAEKAHCTRVLSQ